MSDDPIARFLDPYDDTSILKDGGRAMVNLTQVFERIETGLERIELDPDTPVGLEDILDETTFVAIANTSMVPLVIYHFADCAAGILERRNPAVYEHLDPTELNPSDFGVNVHPEHLDTAKTLLAHRLTHPESSHGDVPAVDNIGNDIQAFVDVMVSMLVFYGVVVAHSPRA